MTETTPEAKTMPKTFSIAAQIDGLRAAGVGNHPMRFEDYRTPMRAAMLRDARAAMLAAAGCPDHIAAGLAGRPLAAWPESARVTLRNSR